MHKLLNFSGKCDHGEIREVTSRVSPDKNRFISPLQHDATQNAGPLACVAGQFFGRMMCCL